MTHTLVIFTCRWIFFSIYVDMPEIYMGSSDGDDRYSWLSSV